MQYNKTFLLTRLIGKKNAVDEQGVVSQHRSSNKLEGQQIPEPKRAVYEPDYPLQFVTRVEKNQNPKRMLAEDHSKDWRDEDPYG